MFAIGLYYRQVMARCACAVSTRKARTPLTSIFLWIFVQHAVQQAIRQIHSVSTQWSLRINNGSRHCLFCVFDYFRLWVFTVRLTENYRVSLSQTHHRKQWCDLTNTAELIVPWVLLRPMQSCTVSVSALSFSVTFIRQSWQIHRA